jgi:NADH-quinone oxidoreductase subunit G
MPKITIDGVEIEAQEGQTILQVASENGIDIPHFCYHPQMKIAGNCRMCLVEIEKVPKLQISCGTQVRDGMVVNTKSEKVVKARRAIMEFLLINHPLDCPICDEAGECRLQDYCFEYGQAISRFAEEKHTFERLDVGPDITRNMNRCIHCTRCIRFLRDIAGIEEAGLSERGGHTAVGPYLEKSYQSPFSMNIVDACPCGALTSRHFRFKARSWLMKKTRSLCASCARGCNAYLWTYQGRVLRMTPAENDQVNQCWLCNAGRLSIERIHAEDRILEPTRSSALDEATGKIKTYLDNDQGDKIGLLISPRLTNEDNYLLCKLAREVIGTSWLAYVPGEPDDRPFGPMNRPLPEWFIRKDAAPNSQGAADMIASGDHTEDARTLINAVASGQIRVLLVFSEDPIAAFSDDPGVAESLENLDLLLVSASHRNLTSERAQMVLPEATFAEKDGSFTNEAGRVQLLSKALEPAGQSRSAWQTAQELAKLLKAKWSYASAADIMREIVAGVPGYEDIDPAALPEQGALKKQPENQDSEPNVEGDPDARVDPVDTDQ